VCAKRKIDKNEDSLLKNPVILTSSKAKRFYTIESRFDTPIADDYKGDFVLPHWRVALDIGNQKKCYIYKLKTLGADKEIIDIWEDYIIKFLPGKDIVPENSVLYLDDNTGGKNSISPSLLAD
jgi:hypothetical protein